MAKLKTLISKAWRLSAPIPTAVAIAVVLGGVFSANIWGWLGLLLYNAVFSILFLFDFFAVREGGIRVERRCPSRLFEGIPQTVDIIARNTGIRPLLLQIRDQTPVGWSPAPYLFGKLGPRDTVRLHYEIDPTERGSFSFGNLWVRVDGPLRLARRQIRVPANAQVSVYPRYEPVGYTSLASFRRETRIWGQRSIKMGRGGRDFESLREYVEGDDPRTIHWKATAKLDRPIVQEFRAERNQYVMILMDTGRLMAAVTDGRTKLDHALEATVRLTQTALSAGDHVGVMAFSNEVRAHLPPKRTGDQLRRILDEIGLLQPVMVESQYESAVLRLKSTLRRRSLIVMFTDIIDEAASASVLEAVGLLRPRHLPLCVIIGETEWETRLSNPPKAVRDVYEKAVLAGLKQRRAEALGRLTRGGSLAADLIPKKLAPGILERYLEVKRRGLL